MVTVITQDERKLQFADANGFQVNHNPSGENPTLTITKRTEISVAHLEPRYQAVFAGNPTREEEVARLEWDDVLVVAIGDVHRG